MIELFRKEILKQQLKKNRWFIIPRPRKAKEKLMKTSLFKNKVYLKKNLISKIT
jgi:hypothetical protein